jgi:chemotaxis signal transduction protein
MTTMTDEQPLLSFRLSEKQYALPIEQVVEVAAMVAYTPLAGTASEVLGVVNRHGEPLVLLDLRRVFDTDAPTVNAATMFIVVNCDNRLAGLVVDEVYGVEYGAKVSPIRSTAHAVHGIYQRDTELVQVIDARHLVATFLPGEIEVR